MPPVQPTTTTTTTAEVPTGTTHTGGTTAEVPTGTTPTGDTTSSPSSHEKDPRIASLHALFPDYDDLILYSVLDSVNGDQDRAIDALLGMSDPEYKGEVHPAADAELDEQLARRLMLEEQDAQQAAWIAQQEEAREARQRPPQPPQQGQQQQGQGDTMAELQQQFGKFAETGKKTFNTFFNKVKAKIQEKDQPRTPQSSTYSYDHSQYEQRTSEHQAYTHVPYATRPRTQVPASQLTPAQQPAYYDPNPSPDPDPRAASTQMQGYDTTPTPGLGLQFEGATTPPNAPTPPPAGTSATTPPPNDTQQRPLTSPPIDGGKYGLLPKRPVTLLRPAEPTQLQRQHSLDDSDDGLEYAESPFEGKK
ncbi:hypothetical protein J132_06274 [Termitomyces sp. J132]|nr:hypothetical protein J132_06274 [Termitomyces sp. J132]